MSNFTLYVHDDGRTESWVGYKCHYSPPNFYSIFSEAYGVPRGRHLLEQCKVVLVDAQQFTNIRRALRSNEARMSNTCGILGWVNL